MLRSLSLHSPALFALVLAGLGACSTDSADNRFGGELFLDLADGQSLALLQNPTENGALSSRFGKRRHPLTGELKLHRGIDLAAPSGTPVLAAEDGMLLFQGDGGTFGNLSRVKHGANVVTVYAHLERFELGLTPGMSVKKGEVIGYIGSTGRSSGPHLHYEVLINGEQIDPLGTGENLLADDQGEGLNKDVADRSGADQQEPG